MILHWCVYHILVGGVLGTWPIALNRIRYGAFSAACVGLVVWALILAETGVTYPTVGRLFGRRNGWRRYIHVGSGGVARGI